MLWSVSGMRHDGRRGEAVACLGLAAASLFWAAAFVAGKVVLAEMTPLSLAAWRFLLAGCVLLPWVMLQFPGRAALRSAVLSLMLMTVFGGVLYSWIFLAALARTSAANTSLLIALNPIFTLCVAALVGERLSRRNVLGAGLSLCGAVVVISHGDWQMIAQLTAVNTGDLLALTAAACWACFNLASRAVVVRLPHMFTNGIVCGVGGLALAIMAAGEGPLRQMLALSGTALACLTLMVLLSSVVAGALFLHGVGVLGVSRAVLFIYLVPPLTVLISLVLPGEPVGAAQLAGGALALGGVYWATRPTPRGASLRGERVGRRWRSKRRSRPCRESR